MAEQEAAAVHKLARRVLVLDFDEKTLIALEQLLEQAGLDTAITWSIHEAFSWLERQRFDLIVVGDHPPDIDAHVLLRWLQAMRQRVPCIVMRAARRLPNDVKPSELVRSIPSCGSPEVLEQAQQLLHRSLRTTQRSTRPATMTLVSERSAQLEKV